MVGTDLKEFEMPKIVFDGPKVIVENKESVERWIAEYTKQYAVGDNYTVTVQNIKPLTKMATELNKVANAFDTKRKDTVKIVKKSLEEFEPFMKESRDTLLDTRASLMAGINEFNDAQTAKRHEANLAYITNLVETAGVAIENIQYDSRWDNKSANRSQMQENVEMQINQLIAQQEQYESNVRVIKQQADALQLPSNPFLENLEHSDLAKILEQMKVAKQQSDELAQEQIKRAEAARAIKESQEEIKGSKVVNIATGEIVGEILTFDLRVKGTLDQMNKLAAYMKEEHITFSRLEAKNEVIS